MLKTLFFLFLFTLATKNSFGQEITYFHKIEHVTADIKLASTLIRRLDSIKQTRRPNDSDVRLFFDRDVDFGYKHQRIAVTFNSIRYLVNLLTKNDTIYFSTVLFDKNFYDKAYNQFNAVKIDTSNCLSYLNKRNTFYKSSKNLNDLKEDFNLTKEYAFYCGDGNPKTNEGKHIEELVKRKEITKLVNLVNSLSCEEQAYGETGLIMLKRSGYKLPSNIEKIITHIKSRNSELVTCEGCFSNLVKKKYDIQ